MRPAYLGSIYPAGQVRAVPFHIAAPTALDPSRILQNGGMTPAQFLAAGQADQSRIAGNQLYYVVEYALRQLALQRGDTRANAAAAVLASLLPRNHFFPGSTYWHYARIAYRFMTEYPNACGQWSLWMTAPAESSPSSVRGRALMVFWNRAGESHLWDYDLPSVVPIIDTACQAIQRTNVPRPARPYQVRPAGQSYLDLTNPYAATLDTSLTAGGSNLQTTGISTTDYGTGAVTPATDNTALYDAVASGLNTAGSTIASIIASGDRMEIARLQNDANLQIAQMTNQANQARAAGNLTLANQQAQQAQQMQMFAQLLQQRNSTTNTPMYILAGLAGLGIIGGIVYFATARPHAKANPSGYARTTRRDVYTHNLKKFNVYLGKKRIDTLYYQANDLITAPEVKRSLIEHDGYAPGIRVTYAGRSHKS